jgi:hypothetical protein
LKLRSATVERIRPDVIYHLAGYVSGSREIEAVLPSLRDNLVSAAKCPRLDTDAREGLRSTIDWYRAELEREGASVQASPGQ